MPPREFEDEETGTLAPVDTPPPSTEPQIAVSETQHSDLPYNPSHSWVEESERSIENFLKENPIVEGAHEDWARAIVYMQKKLQKLEQDVQDVRNRVSSEI